jgi:hypothetical protein
LGIEISALSGNRRTGSQPGLHEFTPPALAGKGDVVILLDHAGAEVNSLATPESVPAEDGARAMSVELRDGQGNLLRWVTKQTRNSKAMEEWNF